MTRDATGRRDVRRLGSWQDLLAATSADPWVQLHADAWSSPGPAWALDTDEGSAVAWTSPDPTDLGELQPVLHLLGAAAPVASLCAHLVTAAAQGRALTLPASAEPLLAAHGVTLDVEVRWHYRAVTAPWGAAPPGPVGWLPEGEAARQEVLSMLERHAPQLVGRADTGHVSRWAGLRADPSGELLAVCADPSPRTAEQGAAAGLLASIAVHREHRRRGLGSVIIRWAADAMFAEGRASVGLAVYADNAGALAAYDRLGFDDRRFATGLARPS